MEPIRRGMMLLGMVTIPTFVQRSIDVRVLANTISARFRMSLQKRNMLKNLAMVLI